MSRSLRVLRLLCCLLVLAVAGLTAGSAPASATWTVYCSGYTRCAAAGYSDGGYSNVSATMYWQMYGGHNCTNYVAYRMVHAGMPNTRPWSGTGNAMNWGVARSDLTDQVPAVGAVAWWKAYAHPAGHVGHVAYVEQVLDADTIVVSQDSWGGDFSWARITRGSGSWPSGFVHFATHRMVSTAPPMVTGTPRAGVALTATAGAWSPIPDVTTYRWQAGGTTIPGATSATYTPTPAQVGKTLTVTVTAARTGWTTVSATSAATAAVRAGVLRVVRAPSVTGSPTVGSVLTADAGAWTPTPTSVSYQWLADGRALRGATAATLPLARSVTGKALSVRVVAQRAGYPSRTISTDPTAAVTLPVITVGVEPAVTGQATVGGRLQVLPGDFSPSDATARTQWFQVGGSRPLGEGTGYTPTPGDVGRQLEARTTVTRPGYAPLVLRSPATPRVVSVPRVTWRAHSTGVPHGSIAVTVTVTAPGVATVPGRVRLSRKGHLLASPRLVGGRATMTVQGLPVGIRVLRLRYTGAPDVTATGLLRKVVRVR